MIRKEDYDLMGMVIIRLSDKEYSEGVGILKFLNLIMYPGRKTVGRQIEVDKYIKLFF